jgi:OPT family oligopeptide transporter
VSIFQKPPTTPEELEAAKPLALSPEEVHEFTEDQWYERVYRGDATQFTLRAVLTGTVLGFFLSLTNIYIGLKTGWFLGVALTACILSYAISTLFAGLGIWKTPMTILENACMASTASSAGYATGNTLVSAFAALLMLSASEANPGGKHLPVMAVAPWVFFLGCLGVSIAVPLKRSMVNQERLKFPSGMASAVTLQGLYSSGKEAMAKAIMLGVTGLISAIWKVVIGLRCIWKVKEGKRVRATLLPEESDVFDWLKRFLPHDWKIFQAHGPELLPATQAPRDEAGNSLGWNLSNWNMQLDHGLVLVAAGILVGLRTTFWMVAGGLFLSFFLGPLGLEQDWVNPAGKLVTAVSAPHRAWKEVGIWLGAPMIVTHGLTSFGAQWRSVLRTFTGLRGSAKTGGNADAAAEAEKQRIRAHVEVPMSWFLGGVTFASAGLMILGQLFFEIPFYYGLLAVAMTFLLAVVSCRVTGETDITPGGAMGKLMQLTYGVLIPQSTTANLMTASITSGAGIAAADLLTDLKAGYLLGANPRRQFVAQASGILTGTIASVGAFYLLVPDATKLLGTSTRGPDFAAPGAQQWRAVAELFRYGIQNLHPLSRKLIFIGASIGIILALLEVFLAKVAPQARKFVPSASGIGLGLILPFSGPLAMFVGALIAEIAPRINKTWADRYLVPLSAGTIAGESIIGVGVAILNNFVFK